MLHIRIGFLYTANQQQHINYLVPFVIKHWINMKMSIIIFSVIIFRIIKHKSNYTRTQKIYIYIPFSMYSYNKMLNQENAFCASASTIRLWNTFCCASNNVHFGLISLFLLGCVCANYYQMVFQRKKKCVEKMRIAAFVVQFSQQI